MNGNATKWVAVALVAAIVLGVAAYAAIAMSDDGPSGEGRISDSIDLVDRLLIVSDKETHTEVLTAEQSGDAFTVEVTVEYVRAGGVGEHVWRIGYDIVAAPGQTETLRSVGIEAAIDRGSDVPNAGGMFILDYETGTDTAVTGDNSGTGEIVNQSRMSEAYRVTIDTDGFSNGESLSCSGLWVEISTNNGMSPLKSSFSAVFEGSGRTVTMTADLDIWFDCDGVDA